MKHKIITVILLSVLISVFSAGNISYAAGNCHIVGYIWEDDNGNGMHETDTEKTIENVTINILSMSRATVATDITGTGGKFEFVLSEGEYIIQVILPNIYNSYSIRAADYSHGVLDHNTSSGKSIPNEFLFEGERSIYYTLNVAASWESNVVDMPDDGNKSEDNTDAGKVKTTPAPDVEPSPTADNGEGDNQSENPTPTPTAETDPELPSPTPTANPRTTTAPGATSAPDSKPTVRPSTKPSDGGGGGAGGGAGGEVQKDTNEASPAPSVMPEPTAAPEPQIKPELNLIDHMAYVSGYPDDTVRPENNITRQEVAALFYRLLTDESREYFYAASNSFTDVPDSIWSNEAISTMSKAGVLNGYSSGEFMPENNITRAEFATIAAKLNDGSYTGADRFNDITGHWAAPYINRAAQLGWISGYDGGIFKPDAYITRAEAMTIINNMLDRHVNPQDMLMTMRKWADNTPDKWYYSAVQEATNSHYYERMDDGYYEAWTEMR